MQEVHQLLTIFLVLTFNCSIASATSLGQVRGNLLKCSLNVYPKRTRII